MVQLKKITKDNLDEVLALSVAEHQKSFVSTVADSLAQVYVYKDTAFPFAIYADDKPVGFIMLGYYESRKQYTLWKFLIDKKYQGKGYGQEALKQGITYLKERFDAKEIYTGVLLGNETAKRLYKSVGFVETGLVEEDMEELRLNLSEKCNIRAMEEKDRACVTEMMREFYSSPAVWSDGSEEIFHTDIECCLGDSPYLEGYVFEENGVLQGYAMVAKSFSTEFGKPCMWIEDLYIKEVYQGVGIGSCFLKYLEEKFPNALFRLEVEAENERAVAVYRKNGFTVLPYMEMKK